EGCAKRIAILKRGCPSPPVVRYLPNWLTLLLISAANSNRFSRFSRQHPSGLRWAGRLPVENDCLGDFTPFPRTRDRAARGAGATARARRRHSADRSRGTRLHPGTERLR